MSKKYLLTGVGLLTAMSLLTVKSYLSRRSAALSARMSANSKPAQAPVEVAMNPPLKVIQRRPPGKATVKISRAKPTVRKPGKVNAAPAKIYLAIRTSPKTYQDSLSAPVPEIVPASKIQELSGEDRKATTEVAALKKLEKDFLLSEAGLNKDDYWEYQTHDHEVTSSLKSAEKHFGGESPAFLTYKQELIQWDVQWKEAMLGPEKYEQLLSVMEAELVAAAQ